MDPDADLSMYIGSGAQNSVFDERPQPSLLDNYKEEDYKKALVDALSAADSSST